MIVNTHLLMSQILYKHLLSNMNFKLDRLAFAYGNIKPDFINKDINCAHTLDESLYKVNIYSEELMSENISIKEFSESLGTICHFVCDYFCLYHRDGNEKKCAYEHLFYEMTLHVKLLTLILKDKLKLKNHEIFQENVENIVLNMEKNYRTEAKCLSKDITYALSGALQISESIVYSSQLYFHQKEINNLKKYQLN
ncbi:zinc dependent phospholipase C family protein [Clostridium estertheticum]|uniref:zinc dependent phospholipase C family protein n=2 Tax=Clostridium estertheticum TaxID=238834 RepID=UPI001CF1ADC4|nr:zinc dependent phospholipase C family protein [Clostridium estertheticum]MCB2345296.1 zinc dependent phospholipase C family protein [Clostridium estertheticum]MCB2350421.1 zinc dependent phospholipase C family protein [Clostridium estertheticum]WAG45186.1 zinc dependent phospholipase C family protein [Clostridium estertheticum]